MAEIEQVAEIVAKYLSHNTVAPADVPNLITAVHIAISSLGHARAVPVTALTPAVPVRRSVTADAITCLDCGWSGQMMKRHLTTAHRLTPDDYRARWQLAGDYPMVARAYAARRSDLAKSIGLGTRGRRKAEATAS